MKQSIRQGAQSFLKWLFFSVALALVPIGAGALIASTRGNDATFEASVSNGELLLVTVAICAAALGELVGTFNKLQVRRIVSGGGATIIMVLSAIYFANVSAGVAAGASLDPGLIAKYSLYLFFAGFVCSALSISFASVGER